MSAEPHEAALPPLSIIIVSRHRPASLTLCLAALERQRHPAIELILVADPESIGVRPDLPMKRIGFDDANISAARNLGLAEAAADIVSFIDDDACAFPDWAGGLARAFTDPRVTAATGWTRGPDGMRFQAKGERIGPDGVTLPVADKAVVLSPENGRVVSTIGTNCAFRRDALLAIGGFDPAFAYFLDESDVNMRLAQRDPGGLTAIVPRAQVVHGAHSGPMRGAAGAPLDLTAIGRSSVLFARRHGGDVGGLVARQRKRLLRLMLTGRLDPFRIEPLLATLRNGMEEGARMALPAPPEPLPTDPSPFQPFPTTDRPAQRLAGWIWKAPVLRRAASEIAGQGAPVLLSLRVPGWLPWRLKFAPGGWWELSGGNMTEPTAMLPCFDRIETTSITRVDELGIARDN